MYYTSEIDITECIQIQQQNRYFISKNPTMDSFTNFPKEFMLCELRQD